MEQFDIQDDLEVNPESYPDREIRMKLPLPGNYVVKPAAWGFRKKKGTDELVLYKDSNGNPKYPVISLQSVEITDPFEHGRKVVVFQDIQTKPFTREGKLASPVADVLRAFDAGLSTSGTGEVIREVTDRFQGQIEFRARIDYSAYDKQYAEKLIAAEGGADALKARGKDGWNKLNEIYGKSAAVRGWKEIAKQNKQRDPEGKLNLGFNRWLGPSGAVVDARPVITVFYKSDDSVQIGPDKGTEVAK